MTYARGPEYRVYRVAAAAEMDGVSRVCNRNATRISIDVTLQIELHCQRLEAD
jgi:hypothetical protein